MKTELYQCPYDAASKCCMEEPCKGCETWAIAQKEQEETNRDRANAGLWILRQFDPTLGGEDKHPKPIDK